MIMKELAENIKDEVFSKLDEIYNHRKQKLGLVSAHNTLINELKRLMIKWVKEKEDWEDALNKKSLIKKFWIRKSKNIQKQIRTDSG